MKHRWTFVVVSMLLVGSVVIVASGAVSGSGKGIYRLVGVFGKVVSLIGSDYVEEIPADRLELGALTGLVEAADPGGAFVPDEAWGDFSRHLERTLPAYGLVLGKRFSYPMVLQVLPGSPAAGAGLTVGELIENVDGQPVRARPLWRAWASLDASERAGKPVSIAVIDRRLAAKRTLKLAAAAFPSPDPSIEMRNEVMLIRVPLVTPASAKTLAAMLRGRPVPAATVLDLRGVALGASRGAVDLAAVIAGGECEVRLVGKGRADEVLREKAPIRASRLVVCIDVTTVGPAELLAGALKARGARLVGGETYGDTGQRSSQRGANGELWMAEAWGVGPDGKALLGDGLKADEVVRARQGADLVLDRALELARVAEAKQAA